MKDRAELIRVLNLFEPQEGAYPLAQMLIEKIQSEKVVPVTAARLHTEAGWLVVSLEIEGLWVEVIRTPVTSGVISHIVESSGIQARYDAI